ncbi:hypothetical protein GGR56DRAFT_390690 [Xylariaceae sp. FL0804]|nr:hypothetical protein GGR56DRAFT_390690 [Xylariaceae sp. FL0804]
MRTGYLQAFVVSWHACAMAQCHLGPDSPPALSSPRHPRSPRLPCVTRQCVRTSLRTMHDDPRATALSWEGCFLTPCDPSPRIQIDLNVGSARARRGRVAITSATAAAACLFWYCFCHSELPIETANMRIRAARCPVCRAEVANLTIEAVQLSSVGKRTTATVRTHAFLLSEFPKRPRPWTTFSGRDDAPRTLRISFSLEEVLTIRSWIRR